MDITELLKRANHTLKLNDELFIIRKVGVDGLYNYIVNIVTDYQIGYGIRRVIFMTIPELFTYLRKYTNRRK